MPCKFGHYPCRDEEDIEILIKHLAEKKNNKKYLKQCDN